MERNLTGWMRVVELGLCMIVKDEEDTIEGCLSPIVDLFEDVLIIDTGSTDYTREVLKDRFGIEPMDGELAEEDCFSKCTIRNMGFAKIRAPWILCLDADERIPRQMLKRLIEIEGNAGTAGYFCRWDTHFNNTVIEDYKLPVFRKGRKSLGLVHENVQTDIRLSGLDALWLDGLHIQRFPDARKTSFKRLFYKQRMLCALKRNPDWYRYHWFLGYTLFRENDHEEALRYLTIAADSYSREFPVECLNSMMVSANIYARMGMAVETRHILTQAQHLGFGEVPAGLAMDVQEI